MLFKLKDIEEAVEPIAQAIKDAAFDDSTLVIGGKERKRRKAFV